MEGSAPSNKPPQGQPSPGSSSNLDSFFKRLGQGQSSRLWAGPGRSSGAVPGSLRTRLHPRNDGGDTRDNVGSKTAAPMAESGARNGTTQATTAARPGAGAASASAAANNNNNSDRRRRNRTAEENLSLSPLGTTGGWSELEGGAGRTSADEIVRQSQSQPASTSRAQAGSLGHPSAPSPSASAAATAARSRTSSAAPFRSSGGTGGDGASAGNSVVFSFRDSEGGDDPLSAPVSPSPAPPPPPPPSTPPGRSPQTPSATTKPAASNVATPPAAPAPAPAPLVSRVSYRDKRFDDVLGEEVVKLDELRKLSWNGVPPAHRAAVWQLLVGYMPANRGRRGAALERKRREYREAVPQYFDVPDAARSHQEQNILRQILVDVPRTCPDVPFFHQDKVQRAMERILYIWAIRHPASGYVQGINDLATPLYVVFLSAHVGPSVESKDVSKVDEALLDEVEADVYWCLTKLLDNIQDHYTAMQPGLQRMVLRLEELVQRIDADLHRHITEEGLLYIQFAFRWMNCLLMRELPQRAVVRAWDTYLAEENGFESFHVYVSAALLCHFSSTLREMDFQSMVMFLQDMPTKEWGEDEVEPLLSQAYILSTLFERSPNHLGAS